MGNGETLAAHRSSPQLGLIGGTAVHLAVSMGCLGVSVIVFGVVGITLQIVR